VRGPDRALCVVERGHHPVTQSLDDAASVRCDSRVLAGADAPQQIQCGVVAHFERPRRELHEVGEQDRHLALAAAAALRL